MRTTYCISMTFYINLFALCEILLGNRIFFFKIFLSILRRTYLHMYSLISIFPLIYSLWSVRYLNRESVILIEPVFIQYGEKRFRGGAFYMETGLTAIGTRYVFRRSRARKLELYFLVRTKSPIDKKNLGPPLPPSLPLFQVDGCGTYRERVGSWEEEGAYRELCGSSTEVHERAPRVRKYMSLLSRGSSYGRQVVADSVRKFRSFREARSPRIPSRPECRPANERTTNERMNEQTSERARNSLSCTAKSVARVVRILISAFLR